jgi:glycosyltransferase involved in cell wall biosynthesis
MTTISIAMATYNGARFIREQLDSLAAQTYLPSELVVTDDGSSDKTLDILADFSLMAPFPVHVYCNSPRLYYKANFMKCASLCSGDLIAFCDQDDVWDQDKLATLVQHLKKAEVDLVFHDFRLVDTDGKPIVNNLSDLFPSLVDYPWIMIRGLTLAFRRKLLRYSDLWEQSVDQHFPSERLAHDQWFVFLAHSFNSLHHISQPLLNYRQHAANLYGVASKSAQLETGLRGNLTAITHAAFGRPDLARAKRNFLHKLLLGRGLSSISRMRVLKEIYQREKSGREAHLLKQIELYGVFGHLYIPRTSIYEQKKIAARLKCFILALENGSYRLNARGLKDALLDIIYGVLLGPALK